MSSIPFERYDEEFDSLTQQVQSSLTGGDIEDHNAHNNNVDLSFASSLLSQCDDLVKQMQVEARGVEDASSKRDLLTKVRVCKARLANLRDDYQACKSQQERESLLLGAEHSGNSGKNNNKSNSDAHRERLLHTQNSLQHQNDTLENARRVMAETEDVAMEITSELGRNREKIEASHSRVRDVAGLTNRARRIVMSMNRREVQQKLMLYVFSAVLVVVVVFLLWNMR